VKKQSLNMSGLVHRDPNGVVWFDDRPVREAADVPRAPCYRSTVWYASTALRCQDWSRLMSDDADDGDIALGSEPGVVTGVSLGVARGGRMRVFDARCWGVAHADPESCIEELETIQSEAAAADMRLRTSAAATAVALYMDRLDGKDGRLALRQLPSQWRGLAHAAMQAGPVAVLRGGADHATHIDIHRAYLQALREPMPVLGVRDGEKVGGWATHDVGLEGWDAIRDLHGFVDAVVRVRGEGVGELPPLPIHAPSGTLYATGLLRGVWSIDLVRDAEERDELDVVEVKQFMRALAVEPVFSDLADLFELLPRVLGKRMYTRFWGKLGSRGGYIGRKSRDPVEGAVPAGGLWWTWQGVAPWDWKRVSRTYRPDIAATVLANNQRRVMAACRKLERGSVIATHVDAIWTSDTAGALRLATETAAGSIGAWRCKRTGPLRYYGFGAYQHGERLVCSGYDKKVRGELTEERLVQFVQQSEGLERRYVLNGRRWSSDPVLDMAATSMPLTIDMSGASSPVDGPEVWSSDWTLSGWYRHTDRVMEAKAPDRADRLAFRPNGDEEEDEQAEAVAAQAVAAAWAAVVAEGR
jgi:hypothetical protein